MANLTQLLTGAINTDPTILEFIACPADPYSPPGLENHVAVRAGKDQYTKNVEFFQVLIKNKGQANEQAFFVTKCPCESNATAQPTAFEIWLDERIATELANDPTIEEIIKEYVDKIQERAQLLVIKNTATGVKRIIAFVYTARDGTHKVQYELL